MVVALSERTSDPIMIELPAQIEWIDISGDGWHALIQVGPSPYSDNTIEARILSRGASGWWLYWVGNEPSVDKAMTAALAWVWGHQSELHSSH